MSIIGRMQAAAQGLWDGLTGQAQTPRVDPRGITPAVPMNWGFQYWQPGTGLQPVAPQSQLDYYRLAGDLSTNSIVAVGLAWIRDNLPQGRLCVGTEDDGEFEPDETNLLYRLFDTQPNPFQNWRQVWGATSDAWKVDGNAYWIKARDGDGLVQELYWVPNDWIRVQVDSLGAIARYIYTPGRTAIQAPQSVGIPYEPADVVHFRDGLDPRNPIVGLSRLKRVIRNIAGYNAGETYTAAILRNSGVSGIALVPKEAMGAIVEDSPDEAAMSSMRRRIKYQSTGESAGDVVALSLPVDIAKLGESPESMMLDRIMDRPEAVICAALGVNALVTGLPASDASRTYSNIEEANKLAWENGIIPMQQAFACTILASLGYEFDLPPEYQVRFDNSKVEALNENADLRAARAQILFQSTLYPRNKALQTCGFDPVDDEADEMGEPEDGQESGSAGKRIKDGDLYYGDQTSVSRDAAVESATAQQEVMAEFAPEAPAPGEAPAGDKAA